MVSVPDTVYFTMCAIAYHTFIVQGFGLSGRCDCAHRSLSIHFMLITLIMRSLGSPLACAICSPYVHRLEFLALHSDPFVLTVRRALIVRSLGTLQPFIVRTTRRFNSFSLPLRTWKWKDHSRERENKKRGMYF